MRRERPDQHCINAIRRGQPPRRDMALQWRDQDREAYVEWASRVMIQLLRVSPMSVDALSNRGGPVVLDVINDRRESVVDGAGIAPDGLNLPAAMSLKIPMRGRKGWRYLTIDLGWVSLEVVRLNRKAIGDHRQRMLDQRLWTGPTVLHGRGASSSAMGRFEACRCGGCNQEYLWRISSRGPIFWHDLAINALDPEQGAVYR